MISSAFAMRGSLRCFFTYDFLCFITRLITYCEKISTAHIQVWIIKFTYFNASCRISRYGILELLVPSVEIWMLYGFAFFKYGSIKPVMRYLYTHIFIQGGLLTVSWYLFKLFWFHFFVSCYGMTFSLRKKCWTV